MSLKRFLGQLFCHNNFSSVLLCQQHFQHPQLKHQIAPLLFPILQCTLIPPKHGNLYFPYRVSILATGVHLCHHVSACYCSLESAAGSSQAPASEILQLNSAKKKNNNNNNPPLYQREFPAWFYLASVVQLDAQAKTVRRRYLQGCVVLFNHREDSTLNLSDCTRVRTHRVKYYV